MIHIANRSYEVVVDHKNGWKPEAFRDRYSEVLERYDYIVGDWGYNQLRLRGFFKDAHPKATKESSIATLQDYLNEYCNFGCAYFIIEKVPSRQQNPNQPQETAGGSDGTESDDLHLSIGEQAHPSELEALDPSETTESSQSQQAQQPEPKQPAQRERNHKPNHHHRRSQHHKQQSQSQGQSQNPKASHSPKQQHVKQQ